MTLQVDFWQLVGLLVAFMGCVAGFGKLLLAQVERRLDQRFSALEKTGAEWQRLERELLTLKADLPIQYVRREDYVRSQTVVEAKLDALAVRLDHLKLREVIRD